MTIKNMTFVLHPRRAATHLGVEEYHGRRAALNLPVDLSQLSGDALRLAEGVYTLVFDGTDDWRVDVRSKLTWSQLVERDWDLPGYQRSFSKNGCASPAEFVANAARFYGDDWVNHYPTFTWKWDSLRPDESPEQYFERHALAISEADGEILRTPDEPHWMTPGEAHKFACKWWGEGFISHEGLRFAFRDGLVTTARQTDGRWRATIGGVIDYLNGRGK